jgi:hypothetical protein
MSDNEGGFDQVASDHLGLRKSRPASLALTNPRMPDARHPHSWSRAAVRSPPVLATRRDRSMHSLTIVAAKAPPGRWETGTPSGWPIQHPYPQKVAKGRVASGWIGHALVEAAEAPRRRKRASLTARRAAINKLDILQAARVSCGRSSRVGRALTSPPPQSDRDRRAALSGLADELMRPRWRSESPAYGGFRC